MNSQAKLHRCTKCDFRFAVTSWVRVSNSPRHLFNSFEGPKRSLELFSYVRCPQCGHEESDPSIKFLGIFPPVAMVWLFAVALLIAVIDAIVDYLR